MPPKRKAKGKGKDAKRGKLTHSPSKDKAAGVTEAARLEAKNKEIVQRILAKEPQKSNRWQKGPQKLGSLDVYPLLKGDYSPLLELFERAEEHGVDVWASSVNCGVCFADLCVLSGNLELARVAFALYDQSYHWSCYVTLCCLCSNGLALLELFGQTIGHLFEYHPPSSSGVEMARLFGPIGLAEKLDSMREEKKKRMLKGQTKLVVVPSAQGFTLEAKAESNDIPSLKSLCALRVVACLSSDVENERLDVAALEALPDDLLAHVGHSFSHLRPPHALQTWQAVVGKFPRLSTVTDFGTKHSLFAAHQALLKALSRFTLVPRDPRAASELVSVFDNLGSFVFAPQSSDNVLPLILPEAARTRPSGLPSVCTREQFHRNFAAFSRGQFKDVDWTNLIAIGGSVGACLAPLDENLIGNVDYFDNVPGNDIDICFVGLNIDTAQALEKLYNQIVSSVPEVPVDVITTSEAITFARHYPFRSIQVMGSFDSISHTLSSVDIDCTAMAFDGKDVWATLRCQEALNHRINTTSRDLYKVRGCPEYERRLLKYNQRGFSIYDLEYDPDNTLPIEEPNPETPFSFRFSYDTGYQSGRGTYPGVGRKLLLLSEKFPWVKEKLLALKSLSVPYGPEWDREKVTRRLEGANEEDDPLAFNVFDSYTHYYTQPALTDRPLQAFTNARITSASRPFLCPLWDFDTNPNLDLTSDGWERAEEEEEEEEEE